jgi:hypothetical protein
MRRTVVVTGAAVALLGPAVGPASAVLPGLAPGTASAAAGWTAIQPPSPGSARNDLYGVAATSATNAWAVGDYFNNANRSQTLIVHWNGTAWKQQSSPSPGSAGTAFNTLSGVAATSSTNAWAVGSYNNGNGTPTQTLILHWNGTAWKQVPSPNPGGRHAAVLSGVAATSATNAWAVGGYGNSAGQAQTLIVHWKGTAWKQVPSPNPSSSGNTLNGVAAITGTHAWAVGYSGQAHASQTLIVHWTGTAWKQVPSPNPSSSGDSNVLSGVTTTSASNAWAVGFDCMMCGGEGQTTVALIGHWNGTAWKQQSSPSPFDFTLNSVAATSATNAWAVGTGFGSTAPIVHWNGTAWKQQSSPSPGSAFNLLYGVAATSATNAWAVGNYSNGGTFRALALHCC